MCTLPNRATVASAAASSSAFSDTSAFTPSTSALVAFRPATALSSAPCSMSHSITFTPACARAVAMPSPIPDAAPVTNAVLPARSFMARPPSASRRQVLERHVLVDADVARQAQHALGDDVLQDLVRAAGDAQA